MQSPIRILPAKSQAPTECRSNKSEKTLDYRSLITSRLEHYAPDAGSLTTPSCAEKVTWIVFLDPALKVPQGQIDAISIDQNARPRQPAAGRAIKWCDPF